MASDSNNSTTLTSTPSQYMNGGKPDYVLSPLFSPLSFSGCADDAMTKRQKIVREIFESEQTYISQLKTVVKLFLEPVRVNCLIPMDSIIAIFNNIEGILAVNMELMRTMRQNSVGQAFTHLAPFMKLYSSYSSNYHNALQVLEKQLKNNPSFAGFIETQEQRPECCSLKLSALLITPIQRIPRYKLLLDDLIKNTKVTHLEYSKLNGALQQIEVVANHMNNYIKQLENSSKMLALQRKFTGSFIPDIVVPGRHFIQEGRLMKVCRRKPKERVLFLFSDLLLYARPNFLDFKAETYTCRGFLPLLSSEVFQLDKDIRVPGITSLIQIVSVEKSVTFFSYKQGEILGWFKLIENAIRDLQISFASFTVPIPRSTLGSTLKSTSETTNAARSNQTTMITLDHTFESSYPLTPGTPMYNLAEQKFFPQQQGPKSHNSIPSAGRRIHSETVNPYSTPHPHPNNMSLDKEARPLSEEAGLMKEEAGLIEERTGQMEEGAGLIEERTGLMEERTELMKEIENDIDKRLNHDVKPNDTSSYHQYHSQTRKGILKEPQAATGEDTLASNEGATRLEEVPYEDTILEEEEEDSPMELPIDQQPLLQREGSHIRDDDQLIRSGSITDSISPSGPTVSSKCCTIL